MQKTKSVALILGVLIMSFLVGYLAFAWTDPTASPPGGNVPAPLNVGTINQIKAGGLGILGGFLADSPTLVVDAVNHRVGIGTTAPVYKLDISGDVRWTGILQGGSVPWARLTSFPSACSSGQYVSAVGSSLTCSTPVGGGDITAVNAGSGLTGGGTSGDVTLNIGAGTGINVGADTVSLAYPSKSCSSGYAIQSFNVGSSAAPTCVAVGGGVPSYTVTTVSGYGFYNPSDVDWGAKAYAYCPSGYVRTGCSGYYPGICWGATACDFYGATPYGTNGCFASARIRSGQWVRVDAYCLRIY